MPQSKFQSQDTKRGEWGGSNYHAYARTAVYANKLMVFLKSLGYEAYGSGTPTLGSNVGFGVMSGLAEYARTSQMISPIFGNTFRTVLPIITNLPLAPTKPINAGILEFCRTCKKCARECPAGALSMADEPFWGGHDVIYQRPGVKGYYSDIKKCFKVMFGESPDCGVCQSVCPFSKFNEASIHQVVKATIGTTPALNQIIAKMDDVFGYGMKTYNVWEMNPWDIPLYGLDSSRS
jgi:reductive dehalogenase